MAGLFIASTGTSIGKTYLTQALIRQAIQGAALPFTASKPIISGWPSDPRFLPQTDTAILLQAQGRPCTPEQIATTSPWRFTLPLTPAAAAIAERKNIVWSHLLAFCHRQLDHAKQQGQIHCIEGVGGVMAPPSPEKIVLDWMADLAIPCVLVVGSYLGTLSHTLTAIEALKNKRIAIAAVIMNETPDSSVPLRQNCDCLRPFIPKIPLFPLRFGEDLDIENLRVITQHLLRYCKKTEKVVDVCA